MKYTKLHLRPLAGLLPVAVAALIFFSCSLLQKQPRLRLEYTISMDLGDLMSRIADNNRDSLFNAAVAQSGKMAEDDDATFMGEMTKIYSDPATEGKLALIFSPLRRYQGAISASDPNARVLKVLSESLGQEMDRVAQVLRKRIDVCGLPVDNDVRPDYAHGTMVIRLRAYDEKSLPEIRRLLSTQGKLEMWDTYENEEIVNDLIEADKALGKMGIKVKDNSPKKPKAPGMAEQLGLPDSIVVRSKQVDKAVEDSINRNPLLKILAPRADNQNGIYPGAAIGVSYGKDTATVDLLMNIAFLKGLFPRDVKFLWASKPAGTQNVFELYAIKCNPAIPGAPIDNEAIRNVEQGYDAAGLPDVTIKMNVNGSMRWERMTDGAAHATIEVDGRSKEVKKCIAIVVDDRVLCAPRVQNKIWGGMYEITGLGGLDEAKEMAAILKGGTTRCRLHILDEKVLSGK